MQNANKIAELAHESPEAEAFFDYLKKRQRNRKEMDIRRIAATISKQYDVKAREIGTLYRKMETLGLGKVVVGRNGAPNKFLLDVKITDIARAASGNTIKSLPNTKEEVDNTVEQDTIVVRKGDITIHLPRNASIEQLLEVVKAVKQAG